MSCTETQNKRRKLNHEEEQKYFTKEEIDTYIQKIKDEYYEIKMLEEQIAQHKKQINVLQQVLVAKCAHNKIPDRCCYDKTTYYCDICGQDLW